MVLVTLKEMFDLVIMTIAVGYIFSGFIRLPKKNPEPLQEYIKSAKRIAFDWENVKFAALIVAPAIVAHELAHKFVALVFGLGATFHASYFGLGIGIALKLLQTGFIFFIPGFVSIIGNATDIQFALIAVAGPATNLLLWLIPAYLVKHKKHERKETIILVLTSKINMILFFLNMLPIPGFDGLKFYIGMVRHFF